MDGEPGPGGAREAPIRSLRAAAYTIPTDRSEADGTMHWTSTTLVVVEVEAGGQTGLGYTYTDGCIVRLLQGKLAEAVAGQDAFDIGGIWMSLERAVRNMGRQGLAATAISAVDTALWDLKAKLLGLPLATLLGRQREAVRIYGSGGFTTYTDEQLREQMERWVREDGVPWVKMKIGADPERETRRVAVAKAAIAGSAGLFVDANGALEVKQALELARRFAVEADVRWFEEPVSSDDLEGLCRIRQNAPDTMEIAAGEYGYDLDYFRRMLAAGAVDVLQADITRCGGVTGFLQVATLCAAHHVPLSGHCAPALHLHACCAAPQLRHLEWFHDHARIERMLFDGAPVPRDGLIWPDLTRPGNGLEFKKQDAAPYAAQ